MLLERLLQCCEFTAATSIERPFHLVLLPSQAMQTQRSQQNADLLLIGSEPPQWLASIHTDNDGVKIVRQIGTLDAPSASHCRTHRVNGSVQAAGD